MCRPSEAVRLLFAACALAAGMPASALTLDRPGASVSIGSASESPSVLEDLRRDAVLDFEARSALARRLLDRFESVGDKAALREALRWIARDWDQQALLRGAPVNRVVVGDCARPVLQWYWLCDGGD